MSRMGVDMTIYVDDIALSSQHIDSAKVINIVSAGAIGAELAISKAKVKVMHSHELPKNKIPLSINESLTRQKKKNYFPILPMGA